MLLLAKQEQTLHTRATPKQSFHIREASTARPLIGCWKGRWAGLDTDIDQWEAPVPAPRWRREQTGLSLAGTGREPGWFGTGLWEAGTDESAGLGIGLADIGPETWRQTGWWEELGTDSLEAGTEQAAGGLVERKQERWRSR